MYPYYIKNVDTGAQVLQDTIKDEFLVRYFASFPPNPITEDPDDPSPFVHMWVQVILENLAMPLNSSLIWEESSAVVTQLQILDFDKGTSMYNSPFAVYVDPPQNGSLYQAEPLNRSSPGFPADCICWTSPSFPTVMTKTQSPIGNMLCIKCETMCRLAT